MLYGPILCSLIFLNLAACSNQGLPGGRGAVTSSLPSGSLGFSVDIEMLFARSCHDCHGGQVQKAGLDLRTVDLILEGGTSGPALVRGNPNKSLIVDTLEDGHMEGKKDPLSAAELSKIRAWIASGAKY